MQNGGGVVPEVAAREHIPQIIPLVKKAMEEAKVSVKEIDKIAVTTGPGLIGSLLVGVETARYLAHFWGKPLIGVNHILGHIFANWLLREKGEVKFPVLVLTVSGGHNELVLMESFEERELIGETIDDAAGEAFDKVARVLGLGYPGGPEISKWAKKGEAGKFVFPRAWMEIEWEKKKGDPENFDFSFSGLKTSVKNKAEKMGDLNDQDKADLALGFEEAVCEVLGRKMAVAAKKFGAKEVHLAGGVSANQRLRKKAGEELEKVFGDESPVLKWPVKMEFCTDNAAMIGGAGFWVGEEMEPGEVRAKAGDFGI